MRLAIRNDVLDADRLRVVDSGTYVNEAEVTAMRLAIRYNSLVSDAFRCACSDKYVEVISQLGRRPFVAVAYKHADGEIEAYRYAPTHWVLPSVSAEAEHLFVHCKADTPPEGSTCD